MKKNHGLDSRQPIRRWPFALVGIVSGALLFGAAELMSVFFAAAASPVVAIGSWLIDFSPPAVKDLAIALFGVYDKVALFVVIGLVSLLIATAIGRLAAAWLPAALALAAALGLLLVAAVLTRASTGPRDMLPTLFGVLLGLCTLTLMTGRARRVASAAPAGNAAEQTAGRGGHTRRDFLRLSSLGLVLAGVMAASGRALSSAHSTFRVAVDQVRLPAPARRAAALPDDVAVKLAAMPPFVTPNEEFYRIDTALSVPRIDPTTWSLRVHGLVEHEITMDFDQLLGQELVETWVTLTCVSNPVGGDLIGNAKWLGYPIRELMARAKPLPQADMVLSTSHDGFSASTPLAALTDGRDALLAVGMNGAPLPAEHGFPVRMVVPGLYGYVSATKWVIDLEVTRFADKQAYWTTRGWSARGPIKFSSRIDVPRGFAQVPAGDLMLGGTAWAQRSGITRVEVQLDGGRWHAAQLAAAAGIDSWRQWSFPVRGLAPGTHTARVRAYDGVGQLQSEQRANPVPNGSSGWHEVSFRVT
ncbi:molybdopterin-dependent oxidoreductase [Glutamicibacter sp. PS]|uniref:molybdopterin-dependent oxidoreductase n=1 Tax=Glutamicibacter sp. PS TaxID=3075634 RepID=UPI0028400873|nr:molybdopterin-dependent oxidoreductase [Glutamicibacter sp. PS]MDR4533368.1 molybdopterin-dependent oxidoreductase [Glutamicibacter sp. PS]